MSVRLMRVCYSHDVPVDGLTDYRSEYSQSTKRDCLVPHDRNSFTASENKVGVGIKMPMRGWAI